MDHRHACAQTDSSHPSAWTWDRFWGLWRKPTPCRWVVRVKCEEKKRKEKKRKEKKRKEKKRKEKKRKKRNEKSKAKRKNESIKTGGIYRKAP